MVERQRRVAGMQEVLRNGRHRRGFGLRCYKQAGSSSSLLLIGKIIVLLSQSAPARSKRNRLLLLLLLLQGGWRCSLVT
jgi:hypothetical protein